MCDLWMQTLEERVPDGAIARQIRTALAGLPPARRIKLYNAGSFFDPGAIPADDDAEIAAELHGFETVTVESHPALVGDRCFRFAAMLSGALEVAMGLETIHPEVLPRLNKGMTSEGFRRAAAELTRRGIAVRAFVLLGLPFVSPAESVEWSDRSMRFAFEAGAGVVSLIPTRAGNGALDELAAAGELVLPTLPMLETASARGVALRLGRVFADLWDAERLRACGGCFSERIGRLERQNRTQTVAPPADCAACGGTP